jgi:hypothetical protein
LVFDPQLDSDWAIKIFFNALVAREAQTVVRDIVRDHLRVWAKAEPKCEDNPSFSGRLLSGRSLDGLVFVGYQPHDRHWFKENVAKTLEAQGIQFWYDESLPGATEEDKLGAKKKCKVALFTLGQEDLTKEQESSLATFESGRCRIIPLIPHHAPLTFKKPEQLSRYQATDFRIDGQEACTRLAEAIRQALEPDVSEKEKPHAFLSYCHDDKPAADSIRDELRKEGFNVWADDKLLPGQDIEVAIREAMEKSYAIVVCLSSNVEKRHESWLFKELRDAVNVMRSAPSEAIKLIPVRLSPCKPPTMSLSPGWLSDLRMEDLFGAKRDEGIKALKAALREALAKR